MTGRLRLTPSVLSWLRCFEAVARLGSFTRAAEELAVSQSAVSQQVRQLEDLIGTRLLERTARSARPSGAAERLTAVLADAFPMVEDTLNRIRDAATDAPLQLSCSPSFAMAWLTPRLGDFYRRHPEVDVRVIGDFQAVTGVDLIAEGVSAAIRFDLGQYDDLNVVEILDEWLVPVASPSFMAEHPHLRGPGDLDGHDLLHDGQPWAGADAHEEWGHWLRRAAGAGPTAVAMADGRQFNLAQLAIAAAISGQGIALGRLALVLPDLEAGRLCLPFRLAVRSRASYHLLSVRQPPSAVVLIRDWLLEAAADFRRRRDPFLVTLGCL